MVEGDDGGGSRSLLPLHRSGHDVEENGALDDEVWVLGCVDSESMADAGAAVVASENEGVRGGRLGEQ